VRYISIIPLISFVALWCYPAMSDFTGESGLPLPRFVSLRSTEVNVRTGPGVRYPILWVFVRKGLPVEVTAEFELWRKIQDIDGAEGWLHRSMISGNRTAIIVEGRQRVFSKPKKDSIPILVAESGVLAELLRCQDSWCKLLIEGLRGWIEQKYLWGVYPGEVIP